MRELWRYRELIRDLTIVDLKAKYQGTNLGFLWSILSPLSTTVVLYFVFRNVFGQEEHFLANLLVGQIAFRTFSAGTSLCLNSVVGRPNLVTKVYIPRQILPLMVALSNLISSLIEFAVLIPILYVLVGRIVPTTVLFFAVNLLLFFFIYGGGLFLSALYVYFRDLNKIWELLVNILFFCSPIFYPLSIVPVRIQTYYLLNPVTRFIMMFRDVMVDGNLPSIGSLLIAIVFSAAACLAGTFVFDRLQRRFAEAI